MLNRDAVMDQAADDISLPYYQYTQPNKPKQLSVPRHVAVILDGNRRWAQERGQPVIAGYRAGGKKVSALLNWCAGTGIEVVTLWPLSADNLKRSPAELQGLLTVIKEVLAELAAARLWRIRSIGQVDQLPADAVTAIRTAESMTADVEGITVNIALAYDGRAEIISAVRALLRERRVLSIADAEITEADITARLHTHGQPDPDLVIRTSGEQRLSGFLPWQTVYSEIFFCTTCWPDFSKAAFDRALKWYGNRCRRFGQ